MNYFIVTYDLNKPGHDYETLRYAIEVYENVHAMDSVYFIKANDNASVIFDRLSQFIDSNDRLFVGEIDGWKARGPYTNFLKGN
jgi:hypothetical protein